MAYDRAKKNDTILMAVSAKGPGAARTVKATGGSIRGIRASGEGCPHFKASEKNACRRGPRPAGTMGLAGSGGSEGMLIYIYIYIYKYMYTYIYLYI